MGHPIESDDSKLSRPRTPANEDTAQHHPRSLRFRAYILGIVLIVLDDCWVFAMERMGKGPTVTTVSLLANAVFILAVLVGLNAMIRRRASRQALSQSELIIVYSMVCVGAAFCGQDWMVWLIHLTGYPYYYASPANQLNQAFIHHLPGWLIVRDVNALNGLYVGDTSLYHVRFIRAWLSPVFCWTGFVVVLMYVMMCINVIVRKQWVERERLTFPIVQLPLAMTKPSGAIWRNRLFWYGFTAAALYAVLNGLHFLYPSVPQIFNDSYPPAINLKNFLVAKPWNAIDMLPINLYPFIVGLGFLLPTDLLFSCWFFYFSWKAQMVVTRAMAWDAVPSFPFARQQAFGGYLAILVVTLWSGRSYYGQVWLKIAGKESELDDSGEAMSYRSAAIGIVAGMLALVAFAWAMGLNPMLGLLSFLIFFWIATSIARIRAEFGSPVHDMGSGAEQFLVPALGSANISDKSLSMLAVMTWFNQGGRQHPMALETEGLRMAAASRASHRRYLYSVMLASFIGMIAAFWVYLHFSYQLGLTNKIIGGTWRGETVYQNYLTNWIKNPTGPNLPAIFATAAGALFCVFLGALRLRFPGLPFHPIGFAISGAWSMNFVWLSLMIAWAIKVLVLRFGGLKLYRKALPFFLGLILGEVSAGMIWSLIGIVFNVTTYRIWVA